MGTETFDLLIVGAGLSGIGAAYHVQSKLPGTSYAILEARESLGGTWDLFRYPGIRSDSDMFTLGYSFRPWTNPQAIADGPSILAYIRETAAAYGIDRHIRYRQRVEHARWSSKHARWELEVRDTGTGALHLYKARFLFVCSGYYDYDGGYTPELADRDRFRGRVVHPQSWTPDVDYDGKRVVVIGSGATAVTLVPALAKRAAHVTMLQRSPTYMMARPSSDWLAELVGRGLSERTAYDVTRWKNILVSMGFFHFCRRFPWLATQLIVHDMKREAGGVAGAARHFTPSYRPWDQRLCLVPDGDLFAELRAGKVSVVTDHIERFTERGIRLHSGEELEADLVVTATGLRLKFLGGIRLEVDGRSVESSQVLVYKGSMLSDVPNLAFAVGYTNASWTLKCDLTSEYVCRLLRHMDAHGYASATPRVTDTSVTAEPILDFTSGYVLRSLASIPKQGSRAPWRLYQNYVLDLGLMRRAPIDDGVLELARASTSRDALPT